MARTTRRTKGEGTLTRRKDGRFEGRFSLGSVSGRRIRKSIYGADAATVMLRLRELQTRHRFSVSTARIREYLLQWLSDGKSRWEPQTYRTYRSIISNHIIRHLGEFRIAALTPLEIKTWMRTLEDLSIGASTRRRALAVLRMALKALVDEWQLDRNPCDPVKGPRVRRKPFHVPRPEEIRQLLDGAEPFWLFCFVLLAFTCTLREGEQFAMHWEQIDLENGSVQIDKALAEDWDGKLERKDPKNKYSIRRLYFPEVAKRALIKLKRMQLAAGYDGPWVFPADDRGPLRKSNFIRRIWRPLLERAGVRYFKVHAARHAGNSLLIARGADPMSIARRMGHADTRMTFDVYGHLFEQSGPAMAMKMEEGLREAGVHEDAYGLSDELAERRRSRKIERPGTRKKRRPAG